MTLNIKTLNTYIYKTKKTICSTLIYVYISYKQNILFLTMRFKMSLFLKFEIIEIKNYLEILYYFS